MQTSFLSMVSLLMGILGYCSYRLYSEKKKNLLLGHALDELYRTCIGFYRLFKDYSTKFEEARKALDSSEQDIDEFNSLKMVFDELQEKHKEMATANHHNALAARKYAKVVSDSSRVLHEVKRLNPGLFERAVEEVRRKAQIERALRNKERAQEIEKRKKQIFVVPNEEGCDGENICAKVRLDSESVPE